MSEDKKKEIYGRLKDILLKLGLKYIPDDEKLIIHIQFGPSSNIRIPVQILISIRMNGRGIHFSSYLKEKKANETYNRYLLEENGKYTFVKWAINKNLDMVCTVDLFADSHNLTQKTIQSILGLIVSSHNRINDRIDDIG
jgi:hypothetical protein